MIENQSKFENIFFYVLIENFLLFNMSLSDFRNSARKSGIFDVFIGDVRKIRNCGKIIFMIKYHKISKNKEKKKN